MLQWFRKKRQPILSPVNGTLISLEKVKDPVFAQRTMGDGIAIEPSGNELFVPVNATILNVFPTKHAVTFKTPYGAELLLHLGIDTVKMKGEPFTITVNANQRVAAGDRLGFMDIDKIISSGLDATVMLINTNMTILKELKKESRDTVKARDTIGFLVYA
ncbi:MAG: PTS glucose transporter subunit IIA [Sporolactobacillus sp.]|jgi:PTS system glucose-specific IIA component|nr:PTS glucose transporter subunit IIA [Sporolactobacillus sp.]